MSGQKSPSRNQKQDVRKGFPIFLQAKKTVQRFLSGRLFQGFLKYSKKAR